MYIEKLAPILYDLHTGDVLKKGEEYYLVINSFPNGGYVAEVNSPDDKTLLTEEFFLEYTDCKTQGYYRVAEKDVYQ